MTHVLKLAGKCMASGWVKNRSTTKKQKNFENSWHASANQIEKSYGIVDAPTSGGGEVSKNYYKISKIPTSPSVIGFDLCFCFF